MEVRKIMQKATKAQLEFIEIIEEFVKEKFKGTTNYEAHLYIQRNIQEFKLNSNHWATVNGYH